MLAEAGDVSTSLDMTTRGAHAPGKTKEHPLRRNPKSPLYSLKLEPPTNSRSSEVGGISLSETGVK